MTSEEFIKIADSQIEKCKSLLGIKSDEYTPANTDRLHFFKSAAELQHETPKQALAGMMSKHTISIYDMCADNQKYSRERWEEKISDSINYLLLLRALVEEEFGSDEQG